MIKKFALLMLVLSFYPVLSRAQISKEYLLLVEQLNEYQEQYAKLSAFGEYYLAITDLNLSDKEAQALVEDSDYDQMLTANKDSISSYELIYYFQSKIIHSMNSILQHPDFGKEGALELISGGELSIVSSEDGKLINFSIDEKTGGTYRSRYSWMHYTGFNGADSSELKKFQAFFTSDGYDGIYTLNTDQGTKYLLTGNVRGCSYCFETFVQLVAFKDNQFHEEFSFSTNNRDWNDGVFYDPKTKTVAADYHFDDLTTSCDCAQNLPDEDAYFFQHTEDPFYLHLLQYRCKCNFVFNGRKFERSQGSLTRKFSPNLYYPELLSFKTSHNQKEVKLITVPDAALGYLFLDTDSLVEFSFPLNDPIDEDFVLSSDKDTLSFTNGDTYYQIYEIERDGKLEAIGIQISIHEKKCHLKGDINTARIPTKNRC